MFKIDVTRFWWIQDNGDDPLDLPKNVLNNESITAKIKLELRLVGGYYGVY